MKKIITILLFIFLICGLAACNTRQEDFHASTIAYDYSQNRFSEVIDPDTKVHYLIFKSYYDDTMAMSSRYDMNGHIMMN